MVVAPSFVSDCLETTIEIGVEYNELFGEMGGDRLDLVESLNDSDEWIGSIIEIIGSAVPLVLTQFGSNY